METKIITVDKYNPDMDKLSYAADVLRSGGTVAFPTETVYGLGANALMEDAVKKIFAAKGRPADNPLIIHISGDAQQYGNQDMLGMLAEDITPEARKLMDAFWPGPLTVVVKKTEKVPYVVTAGLDTVALRMPAHPVANALIKASGVPVAAPSANLSGKPSPTISKHVIEDLMGKVDVIIDGGDADVGLESTVVDVSRTPPVILRPGGITIEQIAEMLPDIYYKIGSEKENKMDSVPRSPGMKYVHYSPKAKVLVIQGNEKAVAGKIKELYKEITDKKLKPGILATTQTVHMYNEGMIITVGDRENPETIAANLFKTFREFDEAGADVILAEGIQEDGIGTAIMNRMRKAAGPGGVIIV